MRFIVILLLLLLTRPAYALQAKIEWNRLPLEKDTTKYENKEYSTGNEYVEALIQGKCSSVWVWMHIDNKTKVKLIDNLKQMFKEKDNVLIIKPAQYYADEIDKTMAGNPEEFKNYQLKTIFKTIAVMDYDFDEGIDKEETARKWLGPAYLDIVKGMMGVK